MSTKRKARPRPSTALVRRKAALPSRRRDSTIRPRPRPRPPAPVPDNMLGEFATLGALGLVEVKLTEREELVLAEPVPVAWVQVKPTGQPYLSHPSYTRWFNRAFGRLGWSIIPRAQPRHDGKSISCPYVLYIHGKPAAFAIGEQEYFESNKEQTYGDAFEATVASALRRCAKRLGVGLELWDRAWLDAFIADYCVKVWLDDPNEKRPKWRLKTSPPFYNEKGAAQAARAQQQQRSPMDEHDQRRAPERQALPPAARPPNPRGEQPITQSYVDAAGKKHPGQLERLMVICRNSGRPDATVKAWLLARYGYASRKDIKQKDYEEICNLIESPTAILAPTGAAPQREREPGEEG